MHDVLEREPRGVASTILHLGHGTEAPLARPSRSPSELHHLGAMKLAALVALVAPFPQDPPGPVATDSTPRDTTIPGAETFSRAEEVASEVGRSIANIDGRFGAGRAPLDSDAIRELFAEDARRVLTGTHPGVEREWRAGTSERPLLVRRRAERAIEPVEASTRDDAIEQVDEMYREIEARLGGRPTRPAEIWTKAVEAVPDAVAETWTVRFRVRHVRRSEAGRGMQTKSIWKVRVVEREGELKIRAWASSIVETVVLSGSSARTGPDEPAFTDVTASVLVGERSAWLAPSIMELRNRLDVEVGVGILGHHGVAVSDVDGDGIEDIYLCQPGGIPNQLWLRRADGTAVESGAALGLGLVDATMSALFLDLDGDGDRDAVLGLSREILVFAQTPKGFSLSSRHVISSVTSLAAADVDGDSRIDVFACAYAHAYDGNTLPNPYFDADNGEANVLLANRTEAIDEIRFEVGTKASKLDVAGSRFSIAASFEDVDDDGDVDLYIANDFGRNAFYFNDGDGHFENRAAELGMEDVGAGMGVSFADVDGDGLVDLYVANMESSAGRRVTGQAHFRSDVDDGTRAMFRRHAKGNTLYLRRRGGGFTESGHASAGQWAWGAIPIDLDGNGALDLFVPNGFVTGTDANAPDL